MTSCAYCTQPVSESHRIDCGCCDKKFHYQCLNIPAPLFGPLKAHKNLFVKCDDCLAPTTEEAPEEYEDDAKENMDPETAGLEEEYLDDHTQEDEYQMLFEEIIEYRCPICTFSAESLHLVRNHVIDVHRMVFCPQCAAVFENLEQLKDHFGASHPDCLTEDVQFIPRFRCKLCSRSYYNEDNFKLHEKYHSQLSTVYLCGQCIQGFSDIDELRRHVVEEHSNE